MFVSAQERQPLSPAVRRRAVAAVTDPACLVIALTTLTALGLRACRPHHPGGDVDRSLR
jgi:hypothetical protein